MYFTPNGRSIQVTGIAPDIELENLPEAYVAARRRHGVREENLSGHFDNISTTPGTADDSPADAEAAPQALPEIDIKEGELGQDPQLDRALELLKSWKVFQTTVAEAKS